MICSKYEITRLHEIQQYAYSLNWSSFALHQLNLPMLLSNFKVGKACSTQVRFMMALECFIITAFILFPKFQILRKGNIMHETEKGQSWTKQALHISHNLWWLALIYHISPVLLVCSTAGEFCSSSWLRHCAGMLSNLTFHSQKYPLSCKLFHWSSSRKRNQTKKAKIKMPIYHI